MRLEFGEVINDAAAEGHALLFKRRLVDDNLRTFRFDALHHALYRRLSEIVRVQLHRQAVNADGAGLLVRRIVLPVRRVVARHCENLFGDEVLARGSLHDRRHHVLQHFGIVGQQLLRVLGQEISSVAERRVVVVCTDARGQSNTIDNSPRVLSLALGIGVEFVEIVDTQG